MTTGVRSSNVPAGYSSMFFHIDESGNTGNILFDINQRTLSHGLLSSKLNVDLLGGNLHRKILMNAVGGRFVHQVVQPVFPSLSTTDTAPAQLTFVEWDSKDALDRFLQSTGFQQHADLLISGTGQFELVRLALPVRSDS